MPAEKQSLPSLDEQLRKLQPEADPIEDLVRAGYSSTAWELLKSEVQVKVKDFFLEGLDENGLTYSQVLSRRRF